MRRRAICLARRINRCKLQDTQLQSFLSDPCNSQWMDQTFSWIENVAYQSASYRVKIEKSNPMFTIEPNPPRLVMPSFRYLFSAPALVDSPHSVANVGVECICRLCHVDHCELLTVVFGFVWLGALGWPWYGLEMQGDCPLALFHLPPKDAVELVLLNIFDLGPHAEVSTKDLSRMEINSWPILEILARISTGPTHH